MPYGHGVHGCTMGPLHFSSNRCVKLPGLEEGKAEASLYYILTWKGNGLATS